MEREEKDEGEEDVLILAVFVFVLLLRYAHFYCAMMAITLMFLSVRLSVFTWYLS